ncbi:uncharacterized protein, partial [Parasteatoda tepidariorum]|uniref:uncharacterized protein n=1 Tax=Parasteatoda tepidariorum TaxID=114398 RepID=UPI0039BC97FB
KTIRTVVQRCVPCKRFTSKGTKTEPITLPAERVQDAATFQVTGVDLAGPLYLKGGHKAWIVLHTCAVYRAIHLELTTSLSTEAFLQSFRRFIARRGRPKIVYSDNGTNFLGANNALTNIDWAQIAKFSTVQKIQWKFNPPTAAWWGGWWERLIQLVKRILRKVLGRAVLSYEELVTVLCDCEQVINSRPLTYVTEDIDDLSPLTPSHFLQELKSDVTDLDNVDQVGLNNRLKYVHQVREHLRKRFRTEYLGQLQQQTVNLKNMRPLSVNDIVLVENDQKRSHWSLARVLQLIPGKDGISRIAKIKTKTGELLRPVQKLYNLEVQDNTFPDSITFTKSGRQVKPPKRLSY